MESQTHKKIILFGIFILLAIFAFLLLRPFISPILTSMILAYLLYPLYSKINNKIKKPTLTAFLICMVVAFLLIIIVLFSAQFAIREILDFYSYTQTHDFTTPIKSFLMQFTGTTFPAEMTSFVDESIEKGITIFISYLSSSIRNLPSLLLQVFILFFTMFYFLRDGKKIINYCAKLIPLAKKIRKKFVDHLKKVTSAIIYGQIVSGIIGGIVVGIGFYLFNAPNPFILTILAIIFGVLPLVGPAFVYIPTGILMILTGNIGAAIGLVIYSLLASNLSYNFIVAKIAEKKAKIPAAIVLLGMFGGIYLFGIIGLIIGPLILDYLLLFIEFYRKKQLG